MLLTFIIRDLRALNVFGLNTILEVIGMRKVVSTYDVNLQAVKEAFEALTEYDNTPEKVLAYKYYQNVKQRRSDNDIQDHKGPEV